MGVLGSVWYIDGVCCHGNKIHDGYNPIYFNLTINKVYKIISYKEGDLIKFDLKNRRFSTTEYLIKDDMNNDIWVPCQLFYDITIEEFRDYQIGKLINT